MERQLDNELQHVRQQLLRLGGLVEQMIADAMKALTDRDGDLCDAVVTRDAEVDHLEKEIDDECRTLMATQQPTAVDLRFLVAAMKITNDLERVGDSAKNIARHSKHLIKDPPLKPYIDLPILSRLAREMLHGSLDAFVGGDVELAMEVWNRDDEVDDLYAQIFRELLTYMLEDPSTVTRGLNLILISSNLERIADHATNISEDVIYFIEGRDIRHTANPA